MDDVGDGGSDSGRGYDHFCSFGAASSSLTSGKADVRAFMRAWSTPQGTLKMRHGSVDRAKAYAVWLWELVFHLPVVYSQGLPIQQVRQSLSSVSLNDPLAPVQSREVVHEAEEVTVTVILTFQGGRSRSGVQTNEPYLLSCETESSRPMFSLSTT